jgi:lipoate-protein ligase B
MRTLDVTVLGLVPYETTLQLQRQLLAERIKGAIGDTLLVCEHPATVTLGKSGSPSSLRVSRSRLEGLGIGFYEVERGGEITFHCPGQLVLYPIINLGEIKRDVGWYMRTLEEVAIQTLSHFGVSGIRQTGKTGVWVQDAGTECPTRKICSLGVKLSRWCTMHGLSLNVAACEPGFSLIDQCGMQEVVATSITEESLVPRTVQEVIPIIVNHFERFFSYSRIGVFE